MQVWSPEVKCVESCDTRPQLFWYLLQLIVRQVQLGQLIDL